MKTFIGIYILFFLYLWKHGNGKGNRLNKIPSPVSHFPGPGQFPGKSGQCRDRYYSQKHCCPTINDCRIYTFAFTQVAPRSRIQNGAVVGSRVELVKRVCCLAGKNCDTAAVLFEDCYNRQKQKSEVLNNRWFDVCVDMPSTGGETTVSYLASKFPFFSIPSINGIVKQGSGLTVHHFKKPGHHLSVALVANHDSPEGTVIQQYRDLGLFVRNDLVTRVSISGPESLNKESEKVVELVKTGKVDLGLMIPVLADTSGTETIFKLDNFDQGNVGILVRKDERCIVEWWDQYLLKFVCSDQYITFCNDMVKQFGPPITVHCVSNATRAEWCPY